MFQIFSRVSGLIGKKHDEKCLTRVTGIKNIENSPRVIPILDREGSYYKGKLSL